MKKYFALSVPFVFMCVCIAIGAHRTHSFAFSEGVYTWILIGGIAYIVLVPILLILTTRSR